MPEPQVRSPLDDILVRMDRNIDRCVRERSRLGYFAVLYRGVTARVRDAIIAGSFDDPHRMERLVVVFANRYLDALDHYWAGGTLPRCWRVAFQSGGMRQPIVLQHLLLGMNAHINLDLAIAAAQVAPRGELSALERDFERITNLLNDMIDAVQDRLEQISPWMTVIDIAGGRTDERVVGFAIGEARALAWQAAESLAACEPDKFQQQVELHDLLVTALAERIRRPGILLGLALEIVRLRETSDVGRVIRTLQAESAAAS